MTTTDGTLPVGDLGWAPDSCTLPTAEQPLRVAEFDDLFTRSVQAIERTDETTARFVLDASATETARDLAARESGCCSFFAFDLTPGAAGTTVMQVRVPASQTAVLDALTARAATAAGLEV